MTISNFISSINFINCSFTEKCHHRNDEACWLVGGRWLCKLMMQLLLFATIICNNITHSMRYSTIIYFKMRRNRIAIPFIFSTFITIMRIEEESTWKSFNLLNSIGVKIRYCYDAQFVEIVKKMKRDVVMVYPLIIT